MILGLKNIKILSILAVFLLGIPLFFSQNPSSSLKTGADQPEKYLHLLREKRVGVVTNHTGKIIRTIKYNASVNGGCALAIRKDTVSIVDFLLENKIDVKKVFAPEHGFRGTADAGEVVKNGIDQKTKLPIISLYDKNKKPSREQIADIDILLFDIQDVGVRFYTYISTLSYIMEAAAENGKKVIVLDRPNPHDGYTDGPILEPQFQSFVGLHPVPVIYGLTIGEYGLMVNGEGWLKGKLKADYILIKMENYSKNQRYSISDKPSPNLPNDVAIQLYPSLCFFEGTQVSVGRGTHLPFQIYGSPWMKNQSFSFVPKPTEGAKKPFLENQTCYGENLSHHRQKSRQLNLEWLIKAYQNFNHKEKKFFLENLFFDKLAGTDQLRKQILQGKTASEIRKSWKKGLKDFEKIRKKYMVYEE